MSPQGLVPNLSMRLAIVSRSISRVYWRRRLGSLGGGGKISRSVKIYRPRQVHLGTDCFLNDFVHIWGGGGVQIGDATMVAAHTVITSQTHDIEAVRKGLLYWKTNEFGPIKIGNNVWIGSNVTILPNVTIGDGAVVAAGAVVASDVAPRSLVGGVPAKLLREL